MEKIKANYSELEWVQDPKGYFLIRINKETKQIEAGFCEPNPTKKFVKTPQPIKMIFGKKAEEIAYTIIREKLVSRLDHAAYLGKELQKAQIALENDLEYIQDYNCSIEKLKK